MNKRDSINNVGVWLQGIAVFAGAFIVCLVIWIYYSWSSGHLDINLPQEGPEDFYTPTWVFIVPALTSMVSIYRRLSAKVTKSRAGKEL